MSAWRLWVLAAALTPLWHVDASAQLLHRRPFKGDFLVTGYFDADGQRGGGLSDDYDCGNWAYDGHAGTDFGLPYGTPVVASATGIVNRLSDGCPDVGGLGNTCGGYFGNWVELVHPDGSLTIYAHLQNGSLAVAAGDEVECGALLGLSASSGNSTGFHLHFGSRDSDATSWGIAEARDLHAGPCSRSATLWTAQQAYRSAPGTECADDRIDVDFWTKANLDDLLATPDGSSIPDAILGQDFVFDIYVRNSSDRTLESVQLGVEIDPAYMSATHVVIESDESGEFRPKDERTSPGDARFALEIGNVPQQRTYRARITVLPIRSTHGHEYPLIGAWVRSISSVYEQGHPAEEPSLNKAEHPLAVQQAVDILSTSKWSFESASPRGWEPCSADTELGAIVDADIPSLTASGPAPCVLSPPWTLLLPENEHALFVDGRVTGGGDVLVAWKESNAESFSDSNTTGLLLRDDYAIHRLVPTSAVPLTRLRIESVTGGTLALRAVWYGPGGSSTEEPVPESDSSPPPPSDRVPAPDPSADQMANGQPVRVIHASGECSTASHRFAEGHAFPWILLCGAAAVRRRRRSAGRHRQVHAPIRRGEMSS